MYDKYDLNELLGKINISTNNKKASLPYSHYSNSIYENGEVTLFGEPEKGLSYDYSDRLWHWNYDKMKEAMKVAKNSKSTNNSCKYFEIMLSHYFDKPIEICHILGCVNHSNGYGIYIFGYREKR